MCSAGAHPAESLKPRFKKFQFVTINMEHQANTLRMILTRLEWMDIYHLRRWLPHFFILYFSCSLISALVHSIPQKQQLIWSEIETPSALLNSHRIMMWTTTKWSKGYYMTCIAARSAWSLNNNTHNINLLTYLGDGGRQYYLHLVSVYISPRNGWK